MHFNLAGRRALVLGGNKGIGYGIARGFADAGADVVLTSRSPMDAEAAAASLGGRAQGIACDTGSLASVDAACAAAGAVDILVLNSGGPPPGSAIGVSAEQWRSSFESMFVGLVRATENLLPAMRARKTTCCSRRARSRRCTPRRCDGWPTGASARGPGACSRCPTGGDSTPHWSRWNSVWPPTSTSTRRPAMPM